MRKRTHGSPPAGGHHLMICWTPDGAGLDFYPDTQDTAELARRLAALVRMLVENPTMIRCAAGDHTDACVCR